MCILYSSSPFNVGMPQDSVYLMVLVNMKAADQGPDVK